jgi:hypothetical protein
MRQASRSVGLGDSQFLWSVYPSHYYLDKLTKLHSQGSSFTIASGILLAIVRVGEYIVSYAIFVNTKASQIHLTVAI